MNRLTKHCQEGGWVINHTEDVENDKCNVVKKLGKLEDLEEELGCPLEVLNAESVMYIRDNETLEGSVYGINLQKKTIMIGSAWSFLEKPLNQFGKTWWLKEDKSE